MVIEYIRYALGNKSAEDFVAAYSRAQEPLRRSSHCLGFELSRCTEDPQAFVLRLEWDSVSGHMEGFRRSPEFQAFFAEVRPYLADISEMRHYQVTDVRWSRPAT